MKNYIYQVTEQDAGERIDKYIASLDNQLSRSYIQRLIKEGQVTVNEACIKVNYKLNAEDVVRLSIPAPETLNIEPENIPLDVLYEDDWLIVVNKPKEMVVHPAAGHYSGTLVNALLYHCQGNLSGINGVLRPGIVHRIDKDTTGALVVCKNDEAHAHISLQLKAHAITRKYNAIVYHNFSEKEGTINAPIGRHPIERKKMAINYKNGKTAVTHYKVLDPLNHRFNHIECQLETGRTHQIRVHMASISHPLVGDTTYGPSKDSFGLIGQSLHARVLGFIHPKTKAYMEFEAPLPPYFTQLLTHLKQS